MLKASDMVHVDENGQVIGGNKVAVNAAGFMIHSAIHKARPDIHAACHTHSPYGKAWSTFGKPVELLNQDSCTFFGIQAVYESFGGVAIEAEEGENIAKVLGKDKRVAILQNHGLLTAGGTVDEAAYLFTLMERTCEVQLLVESAKPEKKYIGQKEAEYTANVNADPVSFSFFYYDMDMETSLLTKTRKRYMQTSSQILSSRYGSQRGSYATICDDYCRLIKLSHDREDVFLALDITETIIGLIENVYIYFAVLLPWHLTARIDTHFYIIPVLFYLTKSTIYTIMIIPHGIQYKATLICRSYLEIGEENRIGIFGCSEVRLLRRSSMRTRQYIP